MREQRFWAAVLAFGISLLLAVSVTRGHAFQSTTPVLYGYRLPTGQTIREVAAGTTIVVIGANLGSSGTIDFNGRPATPIDWTPTAITVPVPPSFSYPTNGTVRVFTGGRMVIGPPFAILAPPPSPPPTISAYRSPEGTAISSALPGAAVIIVGANLGSSGTVTFNGIAASATSWTATAVTATVPSANSYPNSGPVRVTTGGRTATGPAFTINAPPPPPPSISGYRTLDGTSVTSTPAGTSLVIVGTNLGSSGSVRFNGLEATSSAWSPMAVTVTVPTPSNPPSTGPVTVTLGGQTATGADFTITALLPAAPTISGYRTFSGTAVSSAPPGTQIVVVGANLGSTGSARFNGIDAAHSIWTATAVTVTVPDALNLPNTGPVTVTTGGQTATGPSFTITAPPPPPPTITGYRATDGSSLTSALPGTTVLIVGTDLGTSGSVSFNGNAAAYSTWTPTAITVTVPSAASYPNTGIVTVTTGGQPGTGPSFTIIAPPPAVPSISSYRTITGSAINSAAPGTQIVIVGADMGGSGSVRFNGISAMYSSWTPIAITLTVPSAPSYPNTGPVQITTGGQTASGPDFTITEPPAAPPVIFGYRLPTGQTIREVAAGTTIVVIGANLGSSGTIDFNGRPATPIDWTPTAITVPVPPSFSYPTNGTVRVFTGGRMVIGPPFAILAPPPSPPPTISTYRSPDGTAISSALPGAAVVIVGANLGSSGTVTFNGIAASATSWTATAVTATVPSANSYPNSGPVRVTTGGRTATGPAFTINAPPPPPPSISGYRTLDGTSVTSAPAGTSLVIVGTNLGSSGSVRFNGTSATSAAWTPTSITVTVPTPTGYPYTGPVTVTTGGQTATGPAFSITPPPPPPPTITGYRTPGGAGLTSAPPGTVIVIVGSNMGASGTVRFAGISATPSSWSESAITVAVPSAASYPVVGPVEVTTGGQTASGPDFTISAPPPTISDYQRADGTSITSAVAGTTVVIVGNNLGDTGAVLFNGITAVTTAWTPTAITATVPVPSTYPNVGPVTVTTGGQTATGSTFTITAPAPSISGYRSTVGTGLTSAAPGTQIVIVGANLGTSGAVSFNGNPATVGSWTPTAITVTVPEADDYPDTGTVQVTTGGQTGNGPNFTITSPPPTISVYRDSMGASVTSAAPGTTVVIVGTHLGSSGTVSFNGISATTTGWTPTAVTVTVPTPPDYPNTGPVQITTGGQTATGASFTIIAPPAPLPAISAYRDTEGASLNSALPGTQIVIVGANLGGLGTVRFNSIPAASSNWTDTAITVTVPEAPVYPNTGPVQVTTGGQSADGPHFTITGAPPPSPTISDYRTVDASSVTSAAPGTQIVIVGTDLGTTGTVRFNGITATTITWTPTAVTATVPEAASYPSVGPVTVDTDGQTATGPVFTITVPLPAISGYRTLTGSAISSAAPGTQILVVGTHLGTGGTVRFNGIEATTGTWTETEITVTVPEAPTYPNSGPVQVTTGGQTNDGPAFTISQPPPPAPIISSYETTGGTPLTSAEPGTTLVIVGANLGSTGTVKFNGITATTSQWTPTAITVTVPSAPSYPNVGSVTVDAGGQTATGAPFTITAPPSVPGVHNVRDYGATGNGATDDRAAIQRAIDAAQSGEAIYFPAGTYFIANTLGVRVSNLRLYGDGDASTVRGNTVSHHLITVHNSGQTISGIRFQQLRFLGPRVFDKNVNAGNGVGMNNATNTQITACTFEGCGTPIADGDNVSGTTVNNCRFIDWGNVGIFANAGASIRNSSFEQHDPNPVDTVTSHGIYLHSNSNNCIIENCSFSGVRYYGIQIFGQDAGSTITNVRISGNRFSNNAWDIAVQTVGPTISQIYITNNSFTGTRGWSVQLKKGSDLHVDDNTFSGTAGAVLVGDWNIHDAGGSLTNISVDRNIYSGGGASPQNVIYLAGALGTISNVSVRGNSVNSFHEFVPYQGAAIYLDQVHSVTVANNLLTMAGGAGSTNICAGVRVLGGSSVQVTGNQVEGTGLLYAYGVWALLLNSGSTISDNILNHCRLQPGGATESNNQVVFP